jgi:hypothetical protein
MGKSPYDIIRSLIEKVILPKYPFLKINDIDSYNLTNVREYDVRFITPKKLDAEVQMQIDTEVKNLFKMAGLDEMEKFQRNKIATWFKTSRQKDWSFHSTPNYQHI